MDRKSLERLQSHWCTPTEYDFPGDRFIPNRSLMDFDRAHSLLTNPPKKLGKTKYNGEYRRRMEKALELDEDEEGRPFRMLVFRGCPKGSRKSIREIDEMRRRDEESFSCTNVNKQSPDFPNLNILADKSRASGLDSLLSLKTLAIR